MMEASERISDSKATLGILESSVLFGFEVRLAGDPDDRANFKSKKDTRSLRNQRRVDGAGANVGCWRGRWRGRQGAGGDGPPVLFRFPLGLAAGLLAAAAS